MYYELSPISHNRQMYTRWEGCQRAFGQRCLKLLPHILMRIHYCLIQIVSNTHTHTHTQSAHSHSVHKHLATDTPLSPMLQCLPITKEVINSTTAPSREIDFNDTGYMAAVSVPDSHLHTSRDPVNQPSVALQCKAKQDKPDPPSQLEALALNTVPYFMVIMNDNLVCLKKCFTHWNLTKRTFSPAHTLIALQLKAGRLQAIQGLVA